MRRAERRDDWYAAAERDQTLHGYRLLALRVIELAVRDAAIGDATPESRTARQFLSGSSMLTLWCALAHLDADRLVRMSAASWDRVLER